MKGALVALALLFVLLPQTTAVLAQAEKEYKYLAPLPTDYGPQTKDASSTATGSYFANVFAIVIAVAGGLAVVRLVYGGIQYMSTDAISGKNDAKATIQGALWGLLLAIGAWLILNTIDPDGGFTTFNLDIKDIPTTEQVPDESSGGGGGF